MRMYREAERVVIDEGPRDYHGWRLGLTLRQLQHELTEAAGDVLAVGWCRLRRAHLIEPDPCAEGHDSHRWCEACGWCVRCKRRRLDLIGADCNAPARSGWLP